MMNNKLKISPSLREKLVEELILVPEIISSVVKMQVYMRIYGNKKEVQVYRHLMKLANLLDLKDGRAPDYIVNNPMLEIFGRQLLKLVRKKLIKEGLRFTRADTLIISFSVATIIINGNSRQLADPYEVELS